MAEIDTLFIRDREAWYKAGAGLTAAYSGAGVLAISAIMALVSSIFRLAAASTVITTALLCLGWIAAANGIVVLGAREAARRGGVEVDKF